VPSKDLGKTVSSHRIVVYRPTKESLAPKIDGRRSTRRFVRPAHHLVVPVWWEVEDVSWSKGDNVDHDAVVSATATVAVEMLRAKLREIEGRVPADVHGTTSVVKRFNGAKLPWSRASEARRRTRGVENLCTRRENLSSVSTHVPQDWQLSHDSG
jgi:hypothetical protein